MFNQSAGAADWQKQFSNFTAMYSRALPLAQRRLEEAINLMEKNSRTGAELVKKTVEAVQAPSVPESQARWMEVWTSSMKAAQANLEALTQINTRALDSWVDFVRRNTE